MAVSVLSVAQVAAELEISERRVQVLCAQGRLRAEKLGRDWLIQAPLVDPRQSRGRPKK